MGRQISPAEFLGEGVLEVGRMIPINVELSSELQQKQNEALVRIAGLKNRFRKAAVTGQVALIPAIDTQSNNLSISFYPVNE
jgi:hypothetical protein